MTYNECFDSPQFLIFFQEELNRIKKKGRIMMPKSSQKLMAEGLLVPEWMVNEFNLIQRKLSSRPVRDREWIEYFVRSVAARTAVFYDKQAKETPIAIKLKPPKTRKKKNETI